VAIAALGSVSDGDEEAGRARRPGTDGRRLAVMVRGQGARGSSTRGTHGIAMGGVRDAQKRRVLVAMPAARPVTSGGEAHCRARQAQRRHPREEDDEHGAD
jgi:hypothetical protein